MAQSPKYIVASLLVVFVLAGLALSAEAPSTRPDSPAAAPRLDAWKVLGPGGGGAQYFPTVSPHDVNRVMVRCDMTGAYISNDRGDSWRIINFRSGVGGFVFDPVDPDCIYVLGIGLWRTADGGKTWSLVYPSPSDVIDISKAPDHADEDFITAGGPADSVDCIAVDPADSKTLYAVMTSGQRDSRKSRLSVSKDWGATWTDAADLPNGARKLFVSPSSPADNRAVYVVTASSVSVFKDGTLTSQAPPAPNASLTDVVGGFTEDGSLFLYAVASVRGAGGFGPGGPRMDSTTPRGARPVAGAPGAPAMSGAPGAPGGRPSIDSTAAAAFSGRRGGGASELYVSADGGATWKSVSEAIGGKPGPVSGRLSAIAACATKPGVAIVCCSGLTTPANAQRFTGIARTEDFGKTWKLMAFEFEENNEDPDRPAEGASWMYDLYAGRWDGAPQHLGIAPTDPDVCFGTDLGATMRSLDGGRTWRSCNFKALGGGVVTTRGLDVTTCYGVHFDPFNPRRIFISYTDIGAFRSDDGGVSWRIGTTGIPRGWRNTTYWMVFDPEVKGRVWGAFSGPHDLPRPKMWRGGRGRFAGGVAVSDDSGDTWKESIEGMPSTSATHIILDLKSPKESRTLYVAGFGTGVWKSTDGGKSWTLKNKGIEGETPFAWRFAESPDGLLYLIVARRSEDGSIGDAGDGALYRSADAAETWEKVALPEGTNGPNGLLVDPADPRRLYLAAWCRSAGLYGEGGGIFISDDAGKTWRSVFAKDQHVYDVTNDPRDPKVLYACGFENSAWRSTDRGETWTRLKGYNFKWGHRVIPDPYNPGMIYVTTFGGSVWYGPETGDPKALDDIVTPEVSYNR